ncbi:MAG: hypothetical protein QXW82_04815 [Candidatus Bathyarchaeia archaeon]
MTSKGASEENSAVEKAAETISMEDLKECLDRIKESEGIIGYIIRNTKSASIDLKDPSKLIEYAIISSASLESGKELSELFSLGEISSVTIEGGNANVISIAFSDYRVSVFTEKTADLEKILEKLKSLRG